MLLIQASNIHTGGGATLLNALLRSCDEMKQDVHVYHDERFTADSYGAQIKLHSVRANIFARLLIEWRIFKKTKSSDTVLFFGNLPPLFPVKGKCILFFQNLLLLKKTRFDFALRVIVQQTLEKIWLRFTITNIQLVVVQTNSVKSVFDAVYPKKNIVVFPFVNLKQEAAQCEKIYDFVYVSSGDPHKNHLNLLAAWQHLAGTGVYPNLVLTVAPSYTDLLNKISEAQESGLKIINLATATHADVLVLYQKSKCLIFPSVTESFGLPLTEASRAGVPIIASELDYVRDIVEPVQTFDPHSSLSISRAVLRFLKLKINAVQVVHTPAAFLEIILTK